MTKRHHLPPLAPPETRGPEMLRTLCWMVPLWLTIACGLFLYF